jgi:hypothetical protein
LWNINSILKYLGIKIVNETIKESRKDLVSGRQGHRQKVDDTPFDGPSSGDL